MAKKKVNLFIYGSLRDPQIFKSVCGLSFTLDTAADGDDNLTAEPAFLPRHRRVSPDNVYFYAVKDENSKIEGFVIYDVPFRVIAEIDRYEGKRYSRETVTVNTAKGGVDACAYLVSPESMKKHFGDRFHVNLIHELWLRKRIEEFINTHTRPGEKTVDADLERRARRELLATTERDLVISHYRADAFSDYYLEHELDRPLPSMQPLRKQTQAKPYIRNYLALVLRQVLLNQLDEKIQSRYRFELEHMRTSERYFKRSVSLLAALQMINTNGPAVDLITEQCLTTMDHKKHDIVDYVKYAAHIADSIFDPRVAHASLERIRSNFHPGLIPLGAEVELSNLGAKTINAPEETDKDYDCFWYFGDFCLDVLSWKVGGYIDDHTGSTEPGRQRGFFELAPGRLNVARELSRPATADPWLLSQLIQEIVNFYNIRPHSLHLSFQLLKKQIGCQKNLPMEFAKCLLAIGGGLEQNPAGGVWISRIGKKEIIRSDYGEELLFARTSKRRWYVGEDEPGVQTPVQAQTYIQQYKFIRLEKQIGYEPLIMCLKGLQLAYNPGDYLTVEQLGGSKELRQQYEELKKWALKPAKIGKHTINRFVGTVHDGLMNERRGRPAHKLHYIDWAVSAIDMQLQIFNMEIGDAGI